MIHYEIPLAKPAKDGGTKPISAQKGRTSWYYALRMVRAFRGATYKHHPLHDPPGGPPSPQRTREQAVSAVRKQVTALGDDTAAIDALLAREYGPGRLWLGLAAAYDGLTLLGAAASAGELEALLSVNGPLVAAVELDGEPERPHAIVVCGVDPARAGEEVEYRSPRDPQTSRRMAFTVFHGRQRPLTDDPKHTPSPGCFAAIHAP